MSAGTPDHEIVAESDKGVPVTGREWFTIVIFCFVNVVNYMDRFSVAGVLVGIQDYFDIGDDLGGLIQTGFVVSYMLVAPIFGYLGDRFSRRKLLIFSICLWTVTAGASTFASNYFVFLLLRLGVGMGESGFTTVAPTMIADIVSHGLRSIILAVYCFCILVGCGLGYQVSAKVAQYTGHWWWGLRVTPFLSFISAVLLYFCVDPVRGEKEAIFVGGKAVGATHYKEDLVYLVHNVSFLLGTFASTCVAFVLGAVSWWSPKCLYYGFLLIPGVSDIELGDTTFAFGLCTMCSGIVGVAIGSGCSRLLRRSFPRIDPIICGVGLLISAPLLFCSVFSAPHNKAVTFVFVFFGQVTMNLNWAVLADVFFYVVIPTRRATGSAVQTVISHSLGDCFSPYIVGLLSEHFKNFKYTSITETVRRDFYALRLSLLLTLIVEITGGVIFLILALYVIRDRNQAQRLALAVEN